jgi:hypothetical protein
VLATVTRQVTLPVAIQIQTTSATATCKGTLPNPGVHRLTSPFDIARQPHIYSKQTGSTLGFGVHGTGLKQQSQTPSIARWYRPSWIRARLHAVVSIELLDSDFP